MKRSNIKIGIMCACTEETAPFLETLKEMSTEFAAGIKVYKGIFEEIENIEVVVTTCGFCKVNAALMAQILIDRFGCEMIINGGTCGGMAKNVGICDTVVSAETAYWDVNYTVLGQRGEEEVKGRFTIFEAGTKLLEAAYKAAEKFEGKVHFGRTVTGEMFIEHEKRKEINDKFHPLSVDMETTAIAHVCKVNEIPFIAARAVTDTEEKSGLVNFDMNCKSASETSANFIMEILKNL